MIYEVTYYDNDQRTRFTEVNVSLSGLIPFAVKAQNKRFSKVISYTPHKGNKQVPQFQATRKQIKQAEVSLFQVQP